MTSITTHAVSRRSVLQASGSAALLAGVPSAAVAANRSLPSFTPVPKPGTGMPKEGPDTPHLCDLFQASEINARGFNRYKQLGITHVDLRVDTMPIDETTLIAQVKAIEANGLTVAAARLPNPDMYPIVVGAPGRDKAIDDVKATIRAAGKAGIPVLQYALYSHRLNEGLFTAPDPERGNAMLVSFDYKPVKDLPPLPNQSTHSHGELWANASYFIKEVVPVAETSNVRLAQHPNDAPGPVSRGSHQIMSTLEDWKNFIAIVDSPSNGIVFDCGITREIGEDPVSAARYFCERDRINMVHYRNVIMRTPREFYTETYPDMGDENMLAIMKELVRLKYNRTILPEHYQGLDAFHVGYARAMLQVALMER
jgi:mannonate dehydratase